MQRKLHRFPFCQIGAFGKYWSFDDQIYHSYNTSKEEVDIVLLNKDGVRFRVTRINDKATDSRPERVCYDIDYEQTGESELVK